MKTKKSEIYITCQELESLVYAAESYIDSLEDEDMEDEFLKNIKRDATIATDLIRLEMTKSPGRKYSISRVLK